MKTKLMIVLLFVLMVWGCMGCESSPGTTDLSDDRSVLTGTLWQAQQEYIVDTKNWDVLDFAAISDSQDLFSASIYAPTSATRVIKSAQVVYTLDVPSFNTIIHELDALCDLHITASQEGEVVLCLTFPDDSQLFFSQVPGSKGGA
jgi:hypothetical protein